MPRLIPTAAFTLVLVLGPGVSGADSASSSADLTPTSSTSGSVLGDSAHGQQVIEDVGCGACHVIPGVPMANGMVGPPLEHIGSRQYLAGILHNTPDAMVTWIRFPQRIVPGNVMPDMGVSEKDARDIAAYLFTLK